MTRLVTLLLLVHALLPRAIAAQDAIVLRPDASVGALAASIVSGLERRTGREVRAEGVLDDPTARDLGGPVGVARVGERIRIFAMAPSGALHVTEVGAARDDRATARVIVVALTTFLESLEADLAPPVEVGQSPPPVFERYELPLDGSALEDLAPPFRPVDLTPGVVLEVRERVAYATQRDSGSAATGLSLGVCFGTWWCLLADLDAMAPEEDHALDRGGLSYQSTTIGVGGRFLPLELGPVRGGVGIDATARVARVWVDAPAASDTAVSAGMRLMLDLAIRLGGPVFWAIEAGTDVAFNAFRYTRAGRPVFGEDVVALWAAMGLRLGPF